MKDIQLVETCIGCDTPLTLMTSVRTSDNTVWLVKRCLQCGGHPVEEVIQIAEDND